MHYYSGPPMQNLSGVDKAWLAKHPRFKLHFIPTSSSWLNLVERFFAEITGKRIRRGVFKSVAELETAIHEYLDRRNADPKPFVWTKSAATILEKEARAKARLDAIKSGYQATGSEHSDVQSQAPHARFGEAVMVAQTGANEVVVHGRRQRLKTSVIKL